MTIVSLATIKAFIKNRATQVQENINADGAAKMGVGIITLSVFVLFAIVSFLFVAKLTNFIVAAVYLAASIYGIYKKHNILKHLPAQVSIIALLTWNWDITLLYCIAYALLFTYEAVNKNIQKV